MKGEKEMKGMPEQRPEESEYPGYRLRNMSRRKFFASSAVATVAVAIAPKALAEWAPNERYPDPNVQVIDPNFAKYKVFNSSIERLYTGARWGEGPVYFPAGRYLLWSDIPNDRVLKWEEEQGAVSVLRKPSHKAHT